MDYIVLFHFHEDIELCRSRIALLRDFNPGIAIFGLFGGDPDDVAEARTLERLGVEHVFHDPKRLPAWNKKNTDLAVANWYRDVGSLVRFNRVHVVQYDLMFFAPLERVYPKMPNDAVGLTGLIPLQQVAHFWDWIAHEPLAGESKRLLAYARQRFDYSGQPYACIGPGYSLSRAFLDRYSKLQVDDIGHDELRVPLFAQILGVALVDTGFYPRWMDPDIERVFNADAHEVDPALVKSELGRDGGRRVFHPCRSRFDRLLVEQLQAAAHR